MEHENVAGPDETLTLLRCLQKSMLKRQLNPKLLTQNLIRPHSQHGNADRNAGVPYFRCGFLPQPKKTSIQLSIYPTATLSFVILSFGEFAANAVSRIHEQNIYENSDRQAADAEDH